MAYKEADTCWHLLIRTYGGQISILKNLDAPTARQAYRELRPNSRPVKYINAPERQMVGRDSWTFSGGSSMSQVSNHTIVSVDILGPDGECLDPWRGVEPDVVDLGKQDA